MVGGGSDDDGEEEKIGGDGEPTDEEHRTVHPQHREDAAPTRDDAAVLNAVGGIPPLAQKESVPVVSHEDRQAWTAALGTALEYVDYSTVAQKRVSDARRKRGSDLHRGPACPVCGG